VGSDGNTLYSERGFYNTATDRARFADRSKMIDGPRTLSGDSLYYDRKAGLGRAFGHVVLTDTLEKSIITGGYGEYREEPEYALVRDEPIYTLYDDKDSLHIHGDTLSYRLLADGSKKMRIRRGVRMYRRDIQGVCDSMVYNGRDSTFRMYEKPVLWSDKSQLSGDTIWLEMRGGHLDSLRIHGNAFVIESDTLDRYHQIRGKRMKGGFVDDKLHRMKSSGNGQTVYWAREEDGDEVGVNRADCSDLLMIFKEGRPVRITFLVQPDAHLYPVSQAPPDQLILKGFNPRYDERPLGKGDLIH
jgi:lipopolysaccharide export system protein LptA